MESGYSSLVGSSSFSSCTSSNQNSENDSDSDTRSTISYKERRREAHTHAEQKRRDAIKRGYDELQQVVPTCQLTEELGASKLSKAVILQRSIDYVQFLLNHRSKQEANLEKLRKEVMALKIMKANYEYIVKAHQSTPISNESVLPGELKFRVFQQVMDDLFLSFNSSISVNNFAELSACVFNWLENSCKPQRMRESMMKALQNATQKT